MKRVSLWVGKKMSRKWRVGVLFVEDRNVINGSFQTVLVQDPNKNHPNCDTLFYVVLFFTNILTGYSDQTEIGIDLTPKAS